MTVRDGERPSSEYSAEEITYARALDWLRVDDRGFGYISREGVAALEKVRKSAPFASTVVRCEVTGNPCGTDTWFVGHPCSCGPCREFVRTSGLGLAAADDTQPMQALELESKDVFLEEDSGRIVVHKWKT